MPNKKRSKPPLTPPYGGLPQEDKLKALDALIERSDRLEAIRIHSLQIQERCLLSLAIELQILKQIHGGSWRELGEEFFGVADYSTLHKLANRNTYLRRDSYLRITKAVNSYRRLRNLPLIIFPDWEGN